MFGIEVEFNNITRKDAAEVIRATLNGTIDNSASERSPYFKRIVIDQQGRNWTITKDSSVDGPFEEKCELATPPLEETDLPTLQAVIEALKAAGARFSNDRGCGIHLHLSSDTHSLQSIRNFCNIFAAHEDQLFKAFGVDDDRKNHYCKNTEKDFIERLNKKKPTKMEQLADIWYETNGGILNRDDHYNPSRYHALNLHALFHRFHTIEIRLGQFCEATSMEWTVLKSFIMICLAMDKKAKELTTASPKRQADWKSAYSFRCWLLRLGFIGEDTKDVRKFLLQGFEGDKAWKRAAAA